MCIYGISSFQIFEFFSTILYRELSFEVGTGFVLLNGANAIGLLCEE